jgi:hypothetical protein
MTLLIVLPLVFCEARVLKRVLVRDRMPREQRFLLALRRTAQGRCREVRATFSLSHSERFILEVVDGFRVVEDGTGRLPAWPPREPAAAGVCVLVARRPPFVSPGTRRVLAPDPAAPGWTLRAHDASYALFDSAAPAGGGG